MKSDHVFVRATMHGISHGRTFTIDDLSNKSRSSAELKNTEKMVVLSNTDMPHQSEEPVGPEQLAKSKGPDRSEVTNIEVTMLSPPHDGVANSTQHIECDWDSLLFTVHEDDVCTALPTSTVLTVQDYLELQQCADTDLSTCKVLLPLAGFLPPVPTDCKNVDKDAPAMFCSVDPLHSYDARRLQKRVGQSACKGHS